MNCVVLCYSVEVFGVCTVTVQPLVSQLSLPDGAFDCWAYMACNEAVLAIMSRVNPDTLVDSTTSLLLVRAELWHYALEKVCCVT